MSRTGKSDMTAQDVQALRTMGGPFIVRLQRRNPRGQLEQLAYWTDLTIDDLTGDMASHLWGYSGGGEYLLSVYTPEDKSKPKHTYSVLVPGEPRTPEQYKSQSVQPGAPIGSAQQPGWPAVPGAPPGYLAPSAYIQGLAALQPGHPHAIPPYGLMGMPYPGLAGVHGMPGVSLPAAPSPTPHDTAFMMMQHSISEDQRHAQRRAQRIEDQEEEDRRERRRRESERAWREDERLDRASSGGRTHGPPETESLKEAIGAMQAAMAAGQAAAAQAEADRRRSDGMEALRRQMEDARKEAERRAEDVERRHREEMVRLDAQLRSSPGAGVSEAAREDRLERMKAEQTRWEAEMRSREERWAAERADRQKTWDVEQRRWEVEARQRERDASLALAQVRKPDDVGMMGALGGIFGQSQQGNQAMMQAMASIMGEAAKTRELPEWVGKLLTGGQPRSEEMQAITQSAGQLMSIAFGAMAQSMQQMAHMTGQGESPWVRVADRFFEEVGNVAGTLMGKGYGDGGGEPLPIQTPRPALPGRPSRPSAVVTQRASERVPRDAPLSAGDYAGQDAEVQEAVPSDNGVTVIDVEPASPAQTLQARLRQLKHAIRNGALKAVQAARALIEMTQFEIAYSGVLPDPFDRMEDDPDGVVEILLGGWLREFGDSGEQYLATLKEWVAKFVEDGMPDEAAPAAAGAVPGDAHADPAAAVPVATQAAAPDAAQAAAPASPPASPPLNGGAPAPHGSGGGPRAVGAEDAPTPPAAAGL